LKDFANRIARNARHWGKWARRRGIQCYRVYDRDIPEYAFALDVYADRAHLQEYDRAGDPLETDATLHAAWLTQVHQAAADGLGLDPSRVVTKRRGKRRGSAQHEKSGRAGEDFVVQEGGHQFIVNLEAYLDTGLFLDHRNTRAVVAAEVNGKRLLNLFCYTGSFTVYAARSGAANSLGIDLSSTYLNWARRNLDLNGIDPERHVLERGDVLVWLKEAVRAGQRFDMIVLDPPSFSTSKAMRDTLDVQRDHSALIMACTRLLPRGGVLYFSTNLRSFKMDAAATAGLEGEEISARTVPEDFRNRRIHRCWRFTRD
jgi:23S rRNA (cytosine1962-C5)-methyltransferase